MSRITKILKIRSNHQISSKVNYLYKKIKIRIRAQERNKRIKLTNTFKK
jgi:hypothetical protein